jgi:nitrogen-specific signal transduction histidine kinase/CheY-like chemotaxis protein
MTRENQLQQEMEQVRRLDALGQLAGGVAHDFNNMLGGIVGAAEVLRDELADHKMNEFPKLILDSAHGAAELTVQLLSFARKQPVSRKHQHFHPIVNETIAVLKRTIDPRIEIEYRPEAKADVIHGDETLLKSCLLNLGINASHAMPSGGTLTFTTNEVRLTAEDCAESSFDLNQGRHIEVRVEDSGVGIDSDVMKRIFEPFFTTKRNGKGTGLGLAAVFGTVQQHDGSVAVQSTPGCGTTFTIRLPLSAQPANQPKNLDKAVNGEGVILVVDDQPLLRRMATKNLNVLGYEVLTASNGLEALEIYQREQRRIDVVLLDMIMPKMNGRDCFVELKRLDPQVRVIATSGFYSQDDFQEITRLGLSHHLTKPYRRAELSRVVHQAIQATA